MRTRSWLLAALWTAGVVGAESYKTCTAIRPDGSAPNLARLQKQIAGNYGPEYGAKAAAFLRVLQDPSRMEPLPADQQARLEFDVLYTLQSENHRRAHSLSKFLQADGVQRGPSAAPKLHSGTDYYKVRFSLTRPYFVYVFQMDTTGKIDPLFPNDMLLRGEKNPVQANHVYELPPGSAWAFLDNNVGIERFYVLVSTRRKRRLEALFPYFIDASQQIVSGKWRPGEAEVIEAPKFAAADETAVLSRGLGGVSHRPKQEAASPTIPNQTLTFSPTSYRMLYSELLQTLWLKHVR